MDTIQRLHCERHEATYVLRDDEDACPRCQRDDLKTKWNQAVYERDKAVAERHAAEQESERLRAELETAKQLAAIINDSECNAGCDSVAHDDDCPVAHPVAALVAKLAAVTAELRDSDAAFRGAHAITSDALKKLNAARKRIAALESELAEARNAFWVLATDPGDGSELRTSHDVRSFATMWNHRLVAAAEPEPKPGEKGNDAGYESTDHCPKCEAVCPSWHHDGKWSCNRCGSIYDRTTEPTDEDGP